MAFLDMRSKLSRRSGKRSEPLAAPQGNWRGVNYIDDIYTMPAHQIPFAQNVDMGNPIGSITKVAGYESLITSLGSGGIRGLHAWEHSTGDKIIAAWSNYLYLLSGTSGSIAKTSQADWQAGAGVNIDTTTSAGAVVAAKTGTSFSEVDTLTADFNGTHSSTEAAADKVTLTTGTDSSVKLLLHCNGNDASTTFTDEAGKTVTAVVNAQIDTAQKKFGTASGLFDGSGDYLSVPDSADWAYGTGDFTLDMFVRFAALPAASAYMGFVGQYADSDSAWSNFYVYNNAGTYELKYSDGSVLSISNTITLATATWYHIALVRSGTSWYMFKDGTQIGATATDADTTANVAGALTIGCVSIGGSARYFNGHIDEVRISKGLARWTANFTPPVSEYNITGYNTTGTYTHGAQNVSGAAITTGATIAFNATTPANTAVVIETRQSVDGGANYGGWTARLTGATVVPSGTDLSLYRLQWRATLTTTDTAATPSLDDVTLAAATGYHTLATWVSPVLNMANTPLAATLAWTDTEPATTLVVWYVRGSSNGVAFGDWQEITATGGAIPLLQYCQVKFILTGTITATATVSDFLISYSNAYTQANLLDIAPLGRTDNKLTGNKVRWQDYDNRCYAADGLRPFVLYVDAATAVTGAAQDGGGNSICLAAGASAVNDFYNNAFITITGGTGIGQTRFVSDYNGANKWLTVSINWVIAPAATSTYSISSAVKVRKAGVDAPTVAPTLADSGVAGTPNGAYLAKYTFVNEDGFESNPSAASASQSVASKQITWTVPVDASTGNTTASRKLYRTKAGGAVYYYIATIANNTGTAYTDNIADASLTVLMLDNLNVPPATCSIVYSFLTYMFYVSGDELWFSKAGLPENVPNIMGDMQVNICPSTILDVKSNPMALIPQGENFINPITTNSGFIFDSDPTIDTTTMRQIDKNGCLSAEASDICIDPNLRSILVFPTNTGVRSLLPGLQEESIESVPMSRVIQPYFDRTVNRVNMAAIFHNSYYIISMEYHDPTALTNEYITFAYDFRTGEWYGPWEYGMACYAISNNVLYGGDMSVGKIYQMNTGSSFGGSNINMIADLPMLAPAGENRTYKYNKFMMMLSSDSVTTSTTVKPKVDEREATVTIGTLTDTFAGDTRPGHNNIRTRKYRIPLARGSTLSYRIADDSANPFSLQKMITEVEPLPLRK
jgi:hypothetical protein